MQNVKKKKGKLFIISGPSGAGKSTLIEDALKKLPNFSRSVSVTTRPMRKDEENGKRYCFISNKEFEEMINNDKLFEYSQYCGYLYGTPKENIEKELSSGKNLILEIDVKGALQVKNKIKDVYMIFITTPTISELEKRLKSRNTENVYDIENRLKTALIELNYQKYYDCIIVNNDYNEALLNLIFILKTQRGN